MDGWNQKTDARRGGSSVLSLLVRRVLSLTGVDCWHQRSQALERCVDEDGRTGGEDRAVGVKCSGKRKRERGE